MTYTVRLSREAEKDLLALSRSDQVLFRRILSAVKSLADDPRSGKPLVGDHKGEYSLRVGAYRIVYELDHRSRTVFVLTATHRRHVY